tara:strand:- start:722 stop:841 length:120 start_codon:yes stop_codon:yes gene_type:complete
MLQEVSQLKLSITPPPTRAVLLINDLLPIDVFIVFINKF